MRTQMVIYRVIMRDTWFKCPISRSDKWPDIVLDEKTLVLQWIDLGERHLGGVEAFLQTLQVALLDGLSSEENGREAFQKVSL